MSEDLRGRTTGQVLDDHWRLADTGTVDQTLQRNIHPEVVLLTTFGEYTGHDGFLALHRRLREALGEPSFDYRTRLGHGEVGFLEWAASGEGGRIDDGADTYLVRDGWIVVQTIHYTVIHDPDRAASAPASGPSTEEDRHDR